ncbi:MAG: ArsA family ATPase [Acidimicrobiia bacterium]|nr:ArsA family ATPase [Acidimicrobiia bacterium]
MSRGHRRPPPPEREAHRRSVACADAPFEETMGPSHFYAESRVLIVAGKGGVGKSTAAAALARSAARAGLSALLVRLAPGGPVAGLFGGNEPGIDEVVLRPASVPEAAVRGRLVTPDHALAQYLDDNGLGRITRRLVRAGAIDVVTTAAPGIRDLLVLGRVKAMEVARAADVIVLDAPAAGHAIEFLRSPTGLRAAVGSGPIASQADGVLEMLADGSRCRVVLVALAEETPVTEVVETAFALEDEIGVHLGPVLINAVLDAPVGLEGEIDILRGASGDGALDAGAIEALRAAAAFRVERVARQRAQIDRLAALLPLERIELPWLATIDPGPDDLELLADAVDAGLDALATPEST